MTIILVVSSMLLACSPEPATLPVSEQQASLRQQCKQLAGQSLSTEVVVESAEIIIAGKQPREYCLSTAAFTDSRLRFNVWLPTDGWNHRMAFIGGGGFDGVLLDDEFVLIMSPSILASGYAMVSTNGGYDMPDSINPLTYFEAEFASDPEALADFMYRSEHRALPHANSMIEGFYGSQPEYRYFEGCSMGGHDAMLISQRYPDDFDGIIARAPAGNIVGLFLQFNRVGAHLQNNGSELDEEQRELLAGAVLEQCDEKDGLADGIISWPGACTVDASSFLCTSGQSSDCLRPEQVDLIQEAITPLNVNNFEFTHAGYPLNGINQDAGWGEYIWPKLLGYSLQMLFSEGFVRAFVTADPKYDSWQWNPEEWLAELRTIAADYNAFNPDLSMFHQAGAKLILWNGMLDASVSPQETASYYQAVVDTLGQATTDETVELFLSPGVGHCKNGSGPDQVDLMEALATWVEKDIAPSLQQIESYGLDDDGEINRTLPLCKYPAFPRYVSGDPSTAGSYTCSER